MDNELKRLASHTSAKRMALLVGGAVSALSLSLGMAHAAVDAFSKPGTQPCATGEHCPASNQIKGESSQDKHSTDSLSWGSPQGGTTNHVKLDAAGAPHERKAGGESNQLKLDSAHGGTNAIVAPEVRKAGGEQHSVKGEVSSYQSGGHGH